MTSLAAVSCAAALLLISGCAGLQPKVAVDDQGFDVGIHGDWRELGTGLANVFSRRARAAGLPDFTLTPPDAETLALPDGKTIEPATR